MKRLLIFFTVLSAAVCTVSAQVDPNAFNNRMQQMKQRYNQQKSQARQQYESERKRAEQEYADFRRRANEEYAAAMQRAWQQMGVEAPIPKPEKPAPPIPPAPAPEKIPTTKPLPQAEVVPPIPKQVPVPAPPIPETDPEIPTMQFTFYGTDCMVHAQSDDLHFKLSSIDEKGTSEAWTALSKKDYDGMLHDCLAKREALRLGDWGYLRLLQSASEELLGAGSNEAVLLQMYLLAQSGYCVRLARCGGRLALLVPFSRNIYGYPYISIEGKNYFLLDKSENTKVSVCNVGYPREQVANILLTDLPQLESKPQAKRTFSGHRFGTMRAEVGVDKSLIDFMNDYPLSDAWDCYARAGLSEEVKRDLYPVLRSQIEGRSQVKAATMLLDFVQYAFDYATDQVQFGYERPLFADESFYYPKNDCEDRSILYSVLVRDLLGLDVVLVNWPGHLGTAVAFTEEVPGDYYTVDGRRYTVCDPTYIGAGVGETMPNMKHEEAKLVKL